MDQSADANTSELTLTQEAFWRVGTYRWIRAIRRRVLDVVIIAPLVVSGLVWEWRRRDVRPLPHGWVEEPAHSWAIVGQPRGHGPNWLQLGAVLSDINEWINDGHVAAWFPVMIGLVVHLILRGRLAYTLSSEREFFEDREHPPTGRDWIRIGWPLLLLPAAAVAAAVYLLWNGYGSWTSRYVPLLIGIAAAFAVGRAQDRIRRRPLTRAGFRVPARMLVTAQGRRAVRDVAFQHTMMQTGMGWWLLRIENDGAPREPYPEEGASPEAQREGRKDWLLRRAVEFRSAGGVRSLAWLTAWAVDTCVHLGDLDTVEDLLRNAEQTPGTTSQRAYCAAEAAFLDSIGATNMAADRWQDAVNAKGRTPLALRVMAASGSGTAAVALPPSLWRNIALAWSGSGQLLPVQLANRLQIDWPPEQTLTASARLNEFAQAIARQSLVGSTSVYADVVRAHADALITLGDTLAARGQSTRAADAYAAAVEKYTEVKDRGSIGRSLAYTSLHVLAHPRLRVAEAEHALDLLRFGMGLLDGHRIGLRRPQFRSAVASKDEPLHDAVLDLLAQDKRCPPRKKAELALWLMESRRRAARDHMLADPRVPDDPEFTAPWERLQQHEADTTVPPSQDGGIEYKQWEAALSAPGLADAKRDVRKWVDALHASLPAPAATDVSALLQRAGDGVVLALRTRRDQSGWTIDKVTASVRDGISLHRSVLSRPANLSQKAPTDPVSVSHSGALTLDALDDEDRAAVRHLTRNVECDLLAWEEIARAVLPPGLEATLRAPTASDRPPVLLVVPDGPTASLPLAGLPLSEHSLLGEQALVTFVPSLALLREPAAAPPSPAPSRHTTVHLDATGLTSYTEEARLRDNAQIQVTTDRQGLFDALRQQPAHDLVLISAHGESVPTDSPQQERLPRLADHTPLSAATALGLPWPRTVVLGTCWVNRLESAFGRDPVSFPMSCLLRGATTVIGPTGPFHDAVASELFGGCTADFADGADVWSSLFRRLQPHLRNAYGDAAVPAAGSGVALWTLQPPVAPASGAYHAAWGLEGVATTDVPPPRPARPRSGNQLSLHGTSRTFTTAMRHAAEGAQAQEGVVDTLTLALSIAAVEPVARWDDFFQAHGSPVPASTPTTGKREPTSDVELPDGHCVEVTASVAAALDIAILLCLHLEDGYVRSQHVMYGLIHATDSNAHWPLGFAAEPAAQWRRRLSDHAFNGAGLPPLSVLRDQDRKKRPDIAPGEQADDAFWATLRDMIRAGSKALLTTAAAAALIVGLFLQDIERTATTPSLGIELWPLTGGRASTVGYVVPGGPADSVGLQAGDLIFLERRLINGTVSLTVASPPGTPLRSVTLYPVIPRCLITVCHSVSGAASPATTFKPALMHEMPANH